MLNLGRDRLRFDLVFPQAHKLGRRWEAVHRYPR